MRGELQRRWRHQALAIFLGCAFAAAAHAGFSSRCSNRCSHEQLGGPPVSQAKACRSAEAHVCLRLLSKGRQGEHGDVSDIYVRVAHDRYAACAVLDVLCFDFESCTAVADLGACASSCVLHEVMRTNCVSSTCRPSSGHQVEVLQQLNSCLRCAVVRKCPCRASARQFLQ